MCQYANVPIEEDTVVLKKLYMHEVF